MDQLLKGTRQQNQVRALQLKKKLANFYAFEPAVKLDAHGSLSHFRLFNRPNVNQGCHIVYFHTTHPPRTFWKALEWKILISFMAIWYTLWSFA
jgi:hypothetical protein